MKILQFLFNLHTYTASCRQRKVQTEAAPPGAQQVEALWNL